MLLCGQFEGGVNAVCQVVTVSAHPLVKMAGAFPYQDMTFSGTRSQEAIGVIGMWEQYQNALSVVQMAIC